jgi:restriction system protein
MKKLWLVRAGKHGERELLAIEGNKLAPGFFEVDDLIKADTREQVRAKVSEGFPNEAEGCISNFTGQLNQFRNAIQKGDLVIMPQKRTPLVAIGEVTSDYKYEEGPVFHTRSVRWHKTDLPREAFKQDLRHSMGAYMTICQIQRNEALKRVERILSDGKDPGANLDTTGKVAVKSDNGDEFGDEYLIDIEDLVNQQMVGLINSEFAGHDLAQLVGEILEVDGYTVRISPPGPDGGRDILASDGTLGFGDRRICVQVKSGNTAANNQVVLGLQGAMANTKAQFGLLVSLAGVTGEAKKILDDNFFNLRLWQMPELLTALTKAYNKLSDETRAKIPLKQIWVPVMQNEEGEA